MRVEVLWDECEANAICCGIAPDVFELDDEDNLHLLISEIPVGDEETDSPGDQLLPQARAVRALRRPDACRTVSSTAASTSRPSFRTCCSPGWSAAATSRASTSGERVLTGREVAEQISRYAQAFAKVGPARRAARSPMLSPNRPEVLFAMGANMVTGCRASALHPLGSLDDHAYVLEDAEVETLLVDPSFAERAAALLERVPTLRTLLAFGPIDGGIDVTALAASFTPGRLTRPAAATPTTSTGLAYTGGTTGKPKGVMGTYRGGAAMTQIQMAEWQWPDEVRHLICTPLSHAGAAFFVPALLHGGSMVVLPGFEPGKVLEAIEKYKITSIMLVPTMLYVLMDHPDFDKTDLSSLETIFYGAAAMSPTRLAEAIGKLGPIFFQFYGQAECPMTITVLRKEDHDVERPRAAGLLRPAGPVGACRAARRRRQRGARRRARRDLRARAARVGRLLEEAGADGGALRARLAAHRRRRAPRRRGLPLHRRPQEGHDHLRRVQHLPARGRGRALLASRASRRPR